MKRKRHNKRKQKQKKHKKLLSKIENQILIHRNLQVLNLKATQIHKNKVKYNRNLVKKELRKELLHTKI